MWTGSGGQCSAKYGALCWNRTVNEDKIDRRDTIQNMDRKREPSRTHNASHVLLNREFDCDY